ncbi:hypothetical protein MAPG_02800 [Magnaporthiopsis poae ATCC 64411]|uniref:Uncharacterized protein n=1 Tax=Magnaporthiopsis poae (strain ATCC 64411 / 73-15) TaxID=644358 RepID=A0A0C4DSC2_MAGP6|nr:hypothetical protein MAPG_02800 [Magnaporthiopsis poae ATCC 64411]
MSAGTRSVSRAPSLSPPTAMGSFGHGPDRPSHVDDLIAPASSPGSSCRSRSCSSAPAYEWPKCGRHGPAVGQVVIQAAHVVPVV